VFQRTVPVLLDASALAEQRVLAVVGAVPGVLHAHAVRSRRAGRLVFVDLHIIVDPSTDLETAHAVTEAVERALEDTFGPTSTTVHVETTRHCGS
jgi:divalent metal cation (Fe/Co/Zn/Cd) transporter